jgi:type I restriction enzyme M protein
MSTASLVSKVWSFANILRDDGVGYGDYLEQITYLLFLKMADEQTKPPYNKQIDFPRLKDVEGNEIEDGLICNWDTLSNLPVGQTVSFVALSRSYCGSWQGAKTGVQP